MRYDPHAAPPLPLRDIRRLTPDPHVARRRPEGAGEHAQKCGLPGPVGPENGEELARGESKADTVDRSKPAEGPNESLGLQAEVQG